MTKMIPILLIGILLSACAGVPGSISTPGVANTPSSSSTKACSPPSSWKIQYNRSGGFAGFDESMTLDSGGRLTVQSERPPADEERAISEGQVEAITDLLIQACPFEVEPDNGTCADCFIYELDIQLDGRSYFVQATDVTLTEELRPLIDRLTQLLQETNK